MVKREIVTLLASTALIVFDAGCATERTPRGGCESDAVGRVSFLRSARARRDLEWMVPAGRRR